MTSCASRATRHHFSPVVWNYAESNRKPAQSASSLSRWSSAWRAPVSQEVACQEFMRGLSRLLQRLSYAGHDHRSGRKETVVLSVI